MSNSHSGFWLACRWNTTNSMNLDIIWGNPAVFLTLKGQDWWQGHIAYARLSETRLKLNSLVAFVHGTVFSPRHRHTDHACTWIAGSRNETWGWKKSQISPMGMSCSVWKNGGFVAFWGLKFTPPWPVTASQSQGDWGAWTWFTKQGRDRLFNKWFAFSAFYRLEFELSSDEGKRDPSRFQSAAARDQTIP